MGEKAEEECVRVSRKEGVCDWNVRKCCIDLMVELKIGNKGQRGVREFEQEGGVGGMTGMYIDAALLKYTSRKLACRH